MRYWLSSHRDHDGGLDEQSIRIEWTAEGREHTATGSLDGSSIRWTNGTADVPARLADLAYECALDAYEYGVYGCDFEDQETADEMWQACNDAYERARRERDRRGMRGRKGHDEDREVVL